MVQDRELPHLPARDRNRVRARQRAYVEIWATQLDRVRPDLTYPSARAAAHAVFGLLNSTPHSASGLGRIEMAPLLRGHGSGRAVRSRRRARNAGRGSTTTGRLFEDLPVGAIVRHEIRRTVTEADNCCSPR